PKLKKEQKRNKEVEKIEEGKIKSIKTPKNNITLKNKKQKLKGKKFKRERHISDNREEYLHKCPNCNADVIGYIENGILYLKAIQIKKLI
ncbi:hypothetical protein LCGC14_2916730, partial [marine sediment metagenome]